MIPVTYRPSPFRPEHRRLEAPHGSSLTDIVELAVDDRFIPWAHVQLGDQAIGPEHWDRVRPKDGVAVTVALVPQGGGGGGKTALRIVATIAIAVAATYTGGAAAGALGFAAGSTGAAVTGAAVAVGTTVAANLALNALIPIPTQETDGTSDGRKSYALAAENTAQRFGVIPRPLGLHKVVPVMGARPYTEIVGEDQYLRVLLVWGYGPMTISDIKIGSTPIEDFEDVRVQTRFGNSGDTPLTMFPSTVLEQYPNLEMRKVDGWRQRTTDDNVTEISLDFSAPAGLRRTSNNGKNIDPFSVTLAVETSPAGTDTWTSRGTITLTGETTRLIRKGMNFEVAEGRYDVRVQRTTDDQNVDRIIETVVWTTLRGIRSEDPFVAPGVAKTVLRIRASGQISGNLDTVSGIVQTLHKSWNGTSWVSTQPTTNPADLYRAALQGNGNGSPLDDSRIDLDNLQAWHAENDAKGRSFSAVFANDGNLGDALKAIAAAGRARPTPITGTSKWGVVYERTQTTPVQMFTPRNSSGFRSTIVFPDQPHAFRCNFLNAAVDYAQDERIVYADGYDAASATKFETIDFPGITSSAQVFREARYHLAVAKLRPEVFSLDVDVEHLVATSGDMVRAIHDVPLWGLGSGRIKSMTDDGTKLQTITLDERLLRDGTDQIAWVRKQDGTVAQYTINGSAGETAVLDMHTTVLLADAPDIGDLVSVGSEAVNLIVKGIEPRGDFGATLTLVDAAPSVNSIGSGAIPDYDTHVTPPAGLLTPAVTVVRSDESVLVRDTDGALKVAIVISILADSTRRVSVLRSIHVTWRPTGTDAAWSSATFQADASEVTLLDVETGRIYDIRLRYLYEQTRPDGKAVAGPWFGPLTHKVIGTSSKPPDIVFATAENGRLTWRYPDPPPDFAGFQVKSALGTKATWSNASKAHDVLLSSNSFDFSHLSGGTRTLLVKAQDVAGNQSVNPAIVVVELGKAATSNVLFVDDRDAAGWPGTLQNGRVAGGILTSQDNALYLPDGGAPYLADGDAPYLLSDLKQLIWTTTYTVPSNARVGDTLKIDITATNEWSLTYRDAAFWGVKGNPFEEDTYDISGFGWIEDDDEYNLAWPGEIPVTAGQQLTFRVLCKGEVSNFDIIFDALDVTERLFNVHLPQPGGRLPITKSYRVITGVILTLQEDGGTAAWAKVYDKDAALGPLVRGFTVSNGSAACVVDAQIQGY